jgi:hypothetical protein
MGRVPGAQAKQAAEMLESWFTVKHARNITDSEIRIILNHLGFSVTGVKINRQPDLNIRPTQRTWIEVLTEVIEDRNRCPVSIYGSGANGSYRLLCVWDRPAEDDLLGDVGETAYGNPVIVFHFGRMTESRRRDLARLCKERRKTFLVIDDTLMLYLCGERGLRLPVMLDCTLPFTFIEPYTTTAGLVPPEVFYGRERERDSIIAMEGSSTAYIFGGRQLGKTALLREVKRIFEDQPKGRIGLWLDLKALGIGYDRSPDEIWNVILTEFKKLDIIDAKISHIGPEKLCDHIHTWLIENDQRRVLLLLDEADKFLESDGQDNFIRSARLKGLMDKTNRRFKVVFAGLHNVQRTIKQQNDPIAHYGDAVCIGPLLENLEWREARALIERPLASIGYQFEPRDLVFRILSQTNYYPSLIQLYCNQLLRHVTSQQASFDPRTSPPYKITSKHVEEAYQSQDLQRAIRHRFMLTLRLDSRYEVIAYAIAYGCSNDERGLVEGFTISWIRDEVLYWWPRGFRGSIAEDLFRPLLDEMVGLGVLRVAGEDRYSLRSPNVISLLGTKEEIFTKLLESENEEAPVGYQPATFRAAYQLEAGAGPWRGPLTVQQESELRSRTNGTSIIFGLEAAGLDDVERFLLSQFGKEYSLYIEDASDKTMFARHLEGLDNREHGGTTLVLTSRRCPWSESWVEAALQKIERLKSKNKFVRVVFIADPQRTWALMDQKAHTLQLLKSKGLTIFSLKPWHDSALRQWLVDCDFGPINEQGRKRITEITGNWPNLLKEFYRRSKSDPHQWSQYLDELAQMLNRRKEANALSKEMGLVGNQAQRVLKDLATLEEATVEELIGVIDDVPAEVVNQCIGWAELLNIVIPIGNEVYQVDPIVSRILKAVGE